MPCKHRHLPLSLNSCLVEYTKRTAYKLSYFANTDSGLPARWFIANSKSYHSETLAKWLLSTMIYHLPPYYRHTEASRLQPQRCESQASDLGKYILVANKWHLHKVLKQIINLSTTIIAVWRMFSDFSEYNF